MVRQICNKFFPGRTKFDRSLLFNYLDIMNLPITTKKNASAENGSAETENLVVQN